MNVALQWQVATNQLTYDNKKQLHQKGIISDYELEVSANTLATAKAQLSQAQAQLVNARNNLFLYQRQKSVKRCCRNHSYRVGSLVSSAIATPLTVVSNIDQMYASISPWQRNSFWTWLVNQVVWIQPSRPPESRIEAGWRFWIWRERKSHNDQWVIDQTTGSVTIRADFKNAQHLWNQEVVSVRFWFHTSTMPLILIPQTATELQNKKYCLHRWQW